VREIQRGKGNFDGGGPAVAGDFCVRSPHAVPAGIEVGAETTALFGDDQAVNLSAQRIDLENVSVAPVMIGIDENLEMVV
jgi:hypothetical protein